MIIIDKGETISDVNNREMVASTEWDLQEEPEFNPQRWSDMWMTSTIPCLKFELKMAMKRPWLIN